MELKPVGTVQQWWPVVEHCEDTARKEGVPELLRQRENPTIEKRLAGLDCLVCQLLSA
jgi:hypothetical protein